MSSISARIKNNLQILTAEHHISEAELCRYTNIPQATLNRLLTGATDDPRASTLAVIAEYFKISVDQLLGIKPLPTSFDTSTAVTETATFVPLLSQNDLKEWKATSASQNDKYRQWIETESSHKNCLALKVKDESMWPQFAEGTILIVNPNIKPKNRDFVVCYLSEEKQTVYRQYLENDNNQILKPLNSAFPTIKLSKNDKIIGVIVQAKNNFTTSQNTAGLK
jgi:SOS-response transcriptional repressor LexA